MPGDLFSTLQPGTVIPPQTEDITSVNMVAVFCFPSLCITTLAATFIVQLHLLHCPTIDAPAASSTIAPRTMHPA